MTQRTIVILSFTLFVSALLFGGYSLIIYLGVPVHQLVYGTQEDVQTWNIACGSAATNVVYFCRGAGVLFPFLIATFKMASPFFAYTIISALLFGCILLYQGYKTGYFSGSVEWRPVVLIVLFIGSVWLMGTTFSLSTLYNWNSPEQVKLTDTDGSRILPPFRRFFEPTAQIYQGAAPQALQELQANYEDLLSRGCLTDTGVTTQNGAKLYNLRFWCMQSSMFSRVGIQIFMVGFFLFNLLVMGSFFIGTVLRLRIPRTLIRMVLSMGVGALGFVALLWILAIAGLLQPILIRVLFFALPLILFPHSVQWIKASWEQKFPVEFSLKNWHFFLAWLLLTYLALNFLNVVRPFPIGWDDLGSYLNRPRLLSSYGAFIPSMGQFQWEYLTSLGFLIFGYDSWIGSTFAMQINWAAGLLAVLSVYAIGRSYFGSRGGVLSAVMYYFLPMTGHFSFADMKIDNASFFTTALGVLALLAFLFPPSSVSDEGDDGVPDKKLLIVAGLLIGFSFAIKPTAVLGMLMLFSILTGAELGGFGMTGAIIIGFAVLQKFGPLNFVQIANRVGTAYTLSPSLPIIITALLGLGFLGYAMFRQKNSVIGYLKHVGFFAVGVAIAVVPWITYNALHADSITTGTVLSTADTTAPQVYYSEAEAKAMLAIHPNQPVRWLPSTPEDLTLDPHHTACKSSARTEELDRYWGFGGGISHYLFLPWRQVMNKDTFGYYVTFVPALLLFPLLLLLPYFWMKKARWLRLLFVGTFIFLVQWAFVGNGIAWYGIGMFLGFAIALEAFLLKAPDTPNRLLLSFLIGMSIIICVTNRLWQFDSQKNLFEYPLGKITASALREVTIPDYDDIREIVVDRHETMTETPYTYRIGTFISYFIPRNREVFPLADHQLNFFTCLNQEQDHQLTLKRMRALGFNSVIFDTNTQTIEQDPNGSLHQKVAKFVGFINDPVINLEIIMNDPNNGIVYILLPMGSGSMVAQ